MYSTTLNIYDYDNFRVYLKDAVADVKKIGLDFSYRKFSNLAGFSSPNFLILLIKGERNLSDLSAAQIAKAFGLDQIQAHFFRLLVGFNQSKTITEKSTFAKELAKIKSKLNTYSLAENQFDYYSDWVHAVVRELLILNPRLSTAEISQMIQPRQKLETIDKSLQLMEKLGLITKDAHGWTVKNVSLSTGDKFVSSSVVQFHKNMIRLGSECMDRFARDQRNVTSSTVSLSAKNYEEITQKIRDLRQEILALSEADHAKDRVYQFNFQIFPLSEQIKIHPTEANNEEIN